MKHLARVFVIMVAASIAMPLTAVARSSSEPLGTPRASYSVRPSESPEASETPDVSETPEADETPEIDVPDDLEDTADELASKSEDIRKIHVDKEDKTVEVSYELHAKLFGFIDVPYELEAKVDAKKKTVEAHGPWWLLFASDNVPTVQASLSADKTLITQTNQGRVLSRIISILKALASR